MSKNAPAVPPLTIWDIDAVLNLRAGLLRADKVYAYPDQLSIFVDEEGRSAPFAHGVPGSSGLGSVNFALDKQKRRALMERKSIPIPRGATFSFGSGLKRARAYVQRLRFPVALKPTRGDNGVDAELDIKSMSEFDQGLARLSLPPAERSHHTHSGYRTALIGEPVRDEDGSIRVGRMYKFTIEKYIRGALLRFLVVDGEVVSAVVCAGSPSDGSYRGGQDVTAETAGALKDLALRAAEAVPGLAVSAVDIVVRKDSPLSFLRSKAIVVDLNERPDLWVQDLVNEDTAAYLAEVIFENYAKSGHFAFKAPSSEGSYEIEANGLADAESAGEILRELAVHFSCESSSVATDPDSGQALCSISGEPNQIAKLMITALKGEVAGVRFPELVLRRPAT